MSEVRGLPMVNGPPTMYDDSSQPEMACRKCSKEFNIIFNRHRRCNHCGYSYCHSCTEYRAIMPRTDPTLAGYDLVPVCAFCIEFLNITAAGKEKLKAMPLSKLKKYADAYNIKAVASAVEKDDLIDILIATRDQQGCLPRANEEFYRKYSVPVVPRTNPRSRDIFSLFSGDGRQIPTVAPVLPPRPQNTPSAQQPHFARPDLDSYWQNQDHAGHPQYAPPSLPPRVPRRSRPSSPGTRPLVPPRPATSSRRSPSPSPAPNDRRPPSPHPQTHPTASPADASDHASGHPSTGDSLSHHHHHHHHHHYSHPSARTSTRPGYQDPSASSSREHSEPPATSRGPTAPTAPAATRPASTPTLNELLVMTHESISALSVGTLKAILFRNHVTVGDVLEKADLVAKVEALIQAEVRYRKREAEARRLEELREMELRGEAATDEDAADAGNPPSPSSPSSPSLKSKQASMRAALERDGLCVVCQDEEANIAIVDCGHMALCRNCSDQVMQSSRECPLCRTRIVTEARLLRIFKT